MVSTTGSGTPGWPVRIRAFRIVTAAAVVVTVAVLGQVNADAATPAAAGPAAPSSVPPLPADFEWGVATSAFQSEGNPADSNWTRYIAKGDTYDPIGTSVDFRHRYPGYIKLAQQLGVKVFRLGIDWSRVEPRPGVWNRSELAYYDDVVAQIHAAGMRPMITLDHWTYPGWQVDRGGWTRAGMVNDWLTYAKLVVDRYARYDPEWITFNEPFTDMGTEVSNGGLPAFRAGTFFDRLVRAHKAIYAYIHRVQPGAMVSSNVAYFPTVEGVLDAMFLDRVSGQLDFIGIDYYYTVSVEDPTSALSAGSGEPWKARVAADGIYYALRYYATKFPNKPLFIVENGMSTENGKPRPDGYDRADALRDTVYWLQRARADGIDVVGYNYWSLTDNYEWGSYTPRFGLYTVDVLTDPGLTPRATDGVAAYTAITANGGVPATYRPTRPAQFCSLTDGLSSCLNPVR